jgi:hypothetical protein
MQEAWKEIIKDERISISIDLFYFGIVFFNKKISKQNYLLRV